MGKIESIAKWDLANNTWNLSVNEKDKGRCFSFGTYDELAQEQEDTKDIDYVIFAYGSRVEDHSKNYIDIKEKAAGIDKFIKYFSKTKNRMIIKLFLMDADAPIKEDASLLAHYIDSLSILPTTKSINMIGLSKCGAMAIHLPKNFKTASSYAKTNIYTIATPFEGTKMASPKLLYPEVEQLIKSKLGSNNLSNKVYNQLIKFYESISSNSHMDYDIAKLGGVPEDKYKVYDPSLIETIFSQENISALQQVNSYKNICTGIDNKTVKSAVKRVDITGIGLCIINELFLDGKSDGMVLVNTQKKIEEELPTLKSYEIPTTHSITTNQEALTKVLSLVNDTVEEQTDHLVFQKKRANTKKVS